MEPSRLWGGPGQQGLMRRVLAMALVVAFSSVKVTAIEVDFSGLHFRGKPSTTLEEMHAMRELWRERGSSSYTVLYSETNIGSGLRAPVVRVHVEEGRVARVVRIEEGPGLLETVRYTEVERLFEVIREALEGEYWVGAVYHPDLGYPERVRISSVDPDLIADIGGVYFRLWDLKPAP